MVEILNAVVIINVIPARVKMVLKSFVMARFDIPSNDGIMLKIKLTGRILKSIKFKFPVWYGDKSYVDFCWNEKSPVECVVLMSRITQK